jgi:hypothetical protein
MCRWWRTVALKQADYIGPPCKCGECVQAGVSTRRQRRDPHSGEWLHGYRLRHWYEAWYRYRAALAAVKVKTMPAVVGASPARQREPGEEG